MTSTKHILITGASSGIGAACALHLDRLGYRVLAGVRQDADGAALKERSSDRLTPVNIDVTESESVANAREAIAEITGDGGLFGLVNNAGIAVAGPLEALPLDELRRQFEVNVFGMIAVVQAFLPSLVRGGRIINMSSASGRVAFPFVGPYAGSKFALEALSDSLRLELRPSGIFVSVVEPGMVTTPIWERSMETTRDMLADLPEEIQDKYRSMADAVERATKKSMRYAISPERVAGVVATVLRARRPRARYIVGIDSMIASRVVRFLPDRLRDWVLTRAIGLPR